MREQHLARILRDKLIAVVRFPASEPIVQVGRALLEGGIGVIEVTLTVPNALDVLAAVKRDLGDAALVGAGTVLDAATARLAILAGADYIVAPTLDLDTIATCRRYGKLVMPGAFTPTEILKAWEAGADIVKVFPADCLGPAFFKAVRGPLPQVRLMPTGGVTLATAREFLDAGACCLGVGSVLVDPKQVAAGQFEAIRDKARQFVEVVSKN